MTTNTILPILFSQIDGRINDLVNNNPAAILQVTDLWSSIKLEASRYASVLFSNSSNVYIPFSTITTQYVDHLLSNGKYAEAREKIRNFATRIKSLEEEIEHSRWVRSVFVPGHSPLPPAGSTAGTTNNTDNTTVTTTDTFTEDFARHIAQYFRQNGPTPTVLGKRTATDAQSAKPTT